MSTNIWGPISAAVVAFVDAALNLGAAVHLYALSADVLGAVNTLILSGIGAFGTLRAVAQSRGNLGATNGAANGHAT